MLEIASQMILCLLIAALIGFIIGYILGKGTCSKDRCIKPAHKEEKTAPVQKSPETTSTETEPALLSAARDGKKDNLTRIKGIGVKIEEILNDIGIYHFDQIASWKKENITWVDINISFPGRVTREEWVSQAKALSSGIETEFSKRVDAGEVDSSKKS